MLETEQTPIMHDLPEELLVAPCPDLFQLLETILTDGGLNLVPTATSVRPIMNQKGYYGYTYLCEGSSIGQLIFAPLLGGGFFLSRSHLEHRRYEVFTQDGKLNYESSDDNYIIQFVDQYEMEPACPILTLFYNYLSCEYSQTNKGELAHTLQIHSVERFLRSLSKKRPIGIRLGLQDPALALVFEKILFVENDPVLSWEERQVVFSHLKEKISHIMQVKLRAHDKSGLLGAITLRMKYFNLFLTRLKYRPLSNGKGLLYQYTIGKIIWFFTTVKDNLGYSVALAVYGPFTYYFITMPMNPHAMSAVGKVRSFYLDAKEKIEHVLDNDKALQTITPMPLQAVSVPIAPNTPTASSSTDSVSVIAASPVPLMNPNFIGISKITDSVVDYQVNLDGQFKSYRPQLMNLLISSDVPELNRQDWVERMGHFKNMEIAYEENLTFAPRMGRLEQMETQYNFPMITESTWQEMERYLHQIFVIRRDHPNLSAKFRQYLTNEVNRTHQLQLYLWDRMARFILDQPFVMLDQDKEQLRNDYYVGRSFVFMQEMTTTLGIRYQNLPKPMGYEKIDKLAEFYKSNRKEMGDVFKNLVANSDLFKQKNNLDSKELRSYMRRQWEILYLQNSKVEEGSNNGLNLYIWSVRNAIWIMQSIYSGKREEIAIFLKRDENMVDDSDSYELSKLEGLYETLLHNLTLEYVSIKQEIAERLGKDIESLQREVVIKNLRESLEDRAKLVPAPFISKNKADAPL